MTIWIYTLISVLVVSMLSIIGVFTLSLSRDRLNRMMHLLVSFAVGSLFGGAFIHLLPEIFRDENSNPMFTSIFLLLGIVLFFILEKFVRWRHCHDVECHEHTSHLVPMNLVGDSMHNFIDGIIIAVAFQADIQLGIATTIAVALHELPQEIGDFGVLIHGGLSVKRALLYNVLTGLTAIIGAIIALVIGKSAQGFIHALLPMTAGGFIYIAGSDLIPELHHHDEIRKSLAQLFFMILGIGIMAALAH